MQVRNINNILHRSAAFYKRVKFSSKAAVQADALTSLNNSSHKLPQDSAQKATASTFQMEASHSLIEPRSGKQFSLDIYLGSIEISNETVRVGCKIDEINGFKVANFQRPLLKRPQKIFIPQQLKLQHEQNIIQLHQQPKPLAKTVQAQAQKNDHHSLFPENNPKLQEKRLELFQNQRLSASQANKNQQAMNQGFQIQSGAVASQVVPTVQSQLLKNLIGSFQIKPIQELRPSSSGIFQDFIDNKYFTPPSNFQIFANIQPSPYSMPASVQSFQQPNIQYPEFQIPSCFQRSSQSNPFINMGQGKVEKSSKEKGSRNKKLRVCD